VLQLGIVYFLSCVLCWLTDHQNKALLASTTSTQYRWFVLRNSGWRDRKTK